MIMPGYGAAYATGCTHMQAVGKDVGNAAVVGRPDVDERVAAKGNRLNHCGDNVLDRQIVAQHPVAAESPRRAVNCKCILPFLQEINRREKFVRVCGRELVVRVAQRWESRPAFQREQAVCRA